MLALVLQKCVQNHEREKRGGYSKHSVMNDLDPRKEDAVQRLLRHPRNKHISQDEHTHAFWIDKRIRLGGLTRRLKARYYPDWEPPRRIRRAGQSGRVRGDVVHRQLFHMVHCVPRNQCTCVGLKRRTMAIRQNKYTKQVLECLREEGIRLVDGEVPVYCIRGRWATRVDFIGYRERPGMPRRSVLVSLKTGYYWYRKRERRHHGQVYLCAPYGHLPATPHWQHQLQLQAEHRLLRTEYDVHFDEAIVLYVGADKDAKRAILEPLDARSLSTLPLCFS